MSQELMHKLKAAREKMGLSQSQFAAQVLGISVRTLQSWEMNQRTPRGFALQALEEKLDAVLK
jgi:DNA-binding transcriptional regulator YiaG